MHDRIHNTEHISLTEVANVAPGRPSANCVWRWCRRGVRARDGQRIRLQHIRVGGKIFTKREWLDEFGRQLAAADAEYYTLREAAAAELAAKQAPGPRRDQRHRSRFDQRRRVEIEAAERELDARGIR